MVTTPRTRSFRILVCVALILSLLTFNAAVSPGLTSVTVATAAPLSFDTATRARVNATYGRLPLYFEANQGQTDPQVKFLARGGGQTLFLTPTEAVLVLTKANPPAQGPQRTLISPVAARRAGTQAVVRMAFVGASPQPRIAGQKELAGKVNYFLGNDPAKWRTNVPIYAAVRYEGLYPGIDLVYYGNNRQLEYDLVVAPGADPSQIALTFEGADRLEIDANGDLVLHTAVGTIHQRRPIVYQQTNGIRSEVAGAYVLRGGNDIGFQVAAFDGSRPLIIDPVLAYSTLLGGSGWDAGYDIVVDAGGNAYVTGFAGSTDFPTTPGAFQTALLSGPYYSAFVTKLNPTGSGLVYSTYLGGSGGEAGHAIAVDAAGHAYVTGATGSPDFPTTLGAFQTVFSSGHYYNAFVTKLNPNGSGLIYSTYLGGSGDDAGFRITVDAAGNAYVTGTSGSTDFPTTLGAFQTAHSPFNPRCEQLSICFDAFVTKLNPIGSALVYSTYLGGSELEMGNAIAVDAAGSAYVTGYTYSMDFPTTPGAFHPTPGVVADAFVTKLNLDGSGLAYSTYLGGSGGDAGYAIAVDAGGNAYVTGSTGSVNFPTTPGAFQPVHGSYYWFLWLTLHPDPNLCPNPNTCLPADAFITKLNPAGSALVYSTYLGGKDSDGGSSIAIDAEGNVHVTGGTASLNFPTTVDAFQHMLPGCCGSAFVAKINPSYPGVLGLLYSTYLGGTYSDSSSGIAVDMGGNAYVVGTTSSSDFPTTPGAFQTSGRGAFILKIGYR